MEDIKMGNGSISIWGLIAGIAGLIVFIGFFLAQVKFTMDLGFLGTHSVKISGIDLLTNKMDGEKFDYYSFIKIMPFIAALLGLATLVLEALPIFGINSKGIKLAAFICGVLAFVCALLFIIIGTGKGLFSGDFKDGYDASIMSVKAQAGAFLTLIGGIIAGACSACDFFGVKI